MRQRDIAEKIAFLSTSHQFGGNMRVEDIMTNNPFIIPEETSVEHAARMMRDHHIGLIPVGNREKVTGVITDRDIATRVSAESRDPRRTAVREVMTRDNAYCFEDQDIEDACFMMEEKHVRRLLVLDRSLDLVGIVSLDDIAARGRKDKLAGYALEKVVRAA
jgi:CBS domain-containing protein